MYVDRTLDLRQTLEQKSCFLFGPRQTGKTWLINHLFPDSRMYNLLDSDVFLTLSNSPGRLREEHQPGEKLIIIDEIQKLPSLLDEVHLMIESLGVRFLLTGSSARKLRRGGINLLGGRARSRFLHPFTFAELGDRFDLLRALNNGLLPSIHFSDDPEDDLRAYAGDYLREEIAAEALTRNIPAFSRVLQVAATCNGQLINYSKIANDAQVARSTVQEYFGILRDTLIGHDLPPWKGSVKRKPLSTSKFYFFDPGVVRFLQNRAPVRSGSPEFGDAFETYLFHELRTWSDYHRAAPLTYWRSKSGYEVDFILDERTAIEVKATANASPRDLKGLKALKEDSAFEHYLLVCHDPRRRMVDDISIVPWREFLADLWRGAYASKA